MLYGSYNKYDVYIVVDANNRAFGRPEGIPDIFGFRGRIVKSGLPEGDASAIQFASEPTEGYRQFDIATSTAWNLAQEIILNLPPV